MNMNYKHIAITYTTGGLTDEGAAVAQLVIGSFWHSLVWNPINVITE